MMSIRKEILKKGFIFNSELRMFVKQDSDVALQHHNNKIIEFKLNKKYNMIAKDLKVVKRIK